MSGFYKLADVEAAAEAARLAERERCALIVEEFMPQNERSDWTEWAEGRADGLTQAAEFIRHPAYQPRAARGVNTDGGKSDA